MTESNPKLNGYTIHTDDLSEEMAEIAGRIGLNALLRLVELRGGEPLYLPKPERLAIQARNRAIRNDFDGQNHCELARQYGLTTQWIREIVSNRKSTSLDKQHQMKLFNG